MPNYIFPLVFSLLFTSTKLTRTFRAMDKLNFFLKIFTLNAVDDQNQLSWFKSTFLLTCFGFSSGYNIYLHITAESFTRFSPSVVILDILNLLLGVFAYIVDLYYINKLRSETCEYSNVYEQMDLEIPMRFEKEINENVKALVVFLLTAWLISSICEYFVWNLLVGWFCTFYLTTYILSLVRFLVVIDINTHTMQLKYRLKTIVENINDYAATANEATGSIKILRNRRKGLCQAEKRIKPVIINIKNCNDITKLVSYYLLLIEQMKFLNSFFGFRMLVHHLITLLELITFVNIATRTVGGSMMVFRTCLPVMTSSLRFFTWAAVLASLVRHCDSCCNQCSFIIHSIDVVLVNKKISDKVHSSLSSLRNLVTTRPLQFQAAGLYCLDSTLLLSTASVVITYTVILLQSTK